MAARCEYVTAEQLSGFDRYKVGVAPGGGRGSGVLVLNGVH